MMGDRQMTERSLAILEFEAYLFEGVPERTFYERFNQRAKLTGPVISRVVIDARTLEITDVNQNNEETPDAR